MGEEIFNYNLRSPEILRKLFNIPIQEIINKGESEYIEFKSSLRYDNERKDVKKRELEFQVIKTISAFLNSFGGMLVIGVNNNGKIADYWMTI